MMDLMVQSSHIWVSAWDLFHGVDALPHEVVLGGDPK